MLASLERDAASSTADAVPVKQVQAMSPETPSQQTQRHRPATAAERATAREIAALVTACEPITNWLWVFLLVLAFFPGVSLRTALAGAIFRKILARPERVLH